MSDHDNHRPNVKLYLIIFGALMVLTVVTVGVSYLHLPKTAAISLGLAIATLKAGLVAAFFMHLNIEKKYVWYILFAMLAMVGMFFFGTAADIMKPTGSNWEKRWGMRTAGRGSGGSMRRRGRGLRMSW